MTRTNPRPDASSPQDVTGRTQTDSDSPTSSAIESRLVRFVDQPPATPNVQYLRDEERVRALDHLGHCDRVLDVASESGVTAGIDANEVARVDFAPAASDTAQTVLGDTVSEYALASYDDPKLPFDDDSFDAVVCIGPYDWPFLDIDALTAEIRRVVAPGGRFVFSVPTPRSPYFANGKNRFLTPDETSALVSDGWTVVARDFVFQYPRRLHSAVNRLPAPLQYPFVWGARLATALLTRTGRSEMASYVVVAADSTA